MADLRRPTALLPLLALLVALGGCDASIELTDDETDPAVVLDERVSELEARVERLEGNVDGLRETTVVQSENGQFVLRLNTQTAIVVVALIAAIVVLLLGWMRMHAARRDAPPTDEQPPVTM